MSNKQLSFPVGGSEPKYVGFGHQARIITSNARIFTLKARIITSKARIFTSKTRIFTSKARIFSSKSYAFCDEKKFNTENYPLYLKTKTLPQGKENLPPRKYSLT